MDQLIQQHIDNLRDDEIWTKSVRQEKRHINKLKKIAGENS